MLPGEEGLEGHVAEVGTVPGQTVPFAVGRLRVGALGATLIRIVLRAGGGAGGVAGHRGVLH